MKNSRENLFRMKILPYFNSEPRGGWALPSEVQRDQVKARKSLSPVSRSVYVRKVLKGDPTPERVSRGRGAARGRREASVAGTLFPLASPLANRLNGATIAGAP